MTITTFVSHSSLSASERRECEHAFTEARDCVIVATSTLKLGIDVGDLDRVIQINAPHRLVVSTASRPHGTPPGNQPQLPVPVHHRGRGTRRPRHAAMRSPGWVEPVVATPEPRHIDRSLPQRCRPAGCRWRTGKRVGSLPRFDQTAPQIMEHMLTEGFLAQDAGSAFCGIEAEKHFGRRHFHGTTGSLHRSTRIHRARRP
ncbi:helicase-related protein [Rhodococcus opacus]|uniref:helicase-related protein n=1 Tax=Rhodococcus opacus TaxID=37919 RepID=UPI00307A4B4A